MNTLQVLLEIIVHVDHLVIVSSGFGGAIADATAVREYWTTQAETALPQLPANFEEITTTTPTCLVPYCLLGHFPALITTKLHDDLHACAATEAAIVPDRDGSGTMLFPHHDAHRLISRFDTGTLTQRPFSQTGAAPCLRTDINGGVTLRATCRRSWYRAL